MIFPSSRDSWDMFPRFPGGFPHSLDHMITSDDSGTLHHNALGKRRFPHASMEPTSNMARFDNQSKQVSGWWRWTKSSTSYQKSSGWFMNHSLLAKLEEDQLKKWIKLRGIYCVSQMVCFPGHQQSFPILSEMSRYVKCEHISKASRWHWNNCGGVLVRCSKKLMKVHWCSYGTPGPNSPKFDQPKNQLRVGCPARGWSFHVGECTDIGQGPRYHCPSETLRNLRAAVTTGHQADWPKQQLKKTYLISPCRVQWQNGFASRQSCWK